VNIILVDTIRKKIISADDRAATVTAREHRLKDYAELSDLELAQRSEKGDENAFAEIVRRYTPRVFRFVSRFFRQRGVIEEVAQDVFLRIFTQLKSYEGRGSFEGWLTRITVNTCINQLRSAKRETELTVSALSEAESDWLEQKMSDAAAVRHQSDEEKLIAADLVNRVLETMSADDRLVLTLIDGEGHSIRDISEMTGWTESKVKIQAFRARRRMREAVENLMRKTPQQKQQKA
jgi:RNA polymerase sigma-70 factor (ECF subfamily)